MISEGSPDNQTADAALQFDLISCYTLCFVNLITAIVLAWLVYLVIKRLSAKDMVLPTMLFFCCLSSIGSVYYFIVRIYQDYQQKEEVSADPTSYKLSSIQCATLISQFLPCYFLTFAVILNINKWIYFKYRIQSLAVQIKVNRSDISIDSKAIFDNETVKLERIVKYINMGTGLAMFLYFAFTTSYMVYGCSGTFASQEKYESHCLKVLANSTAIVFFALAIAFFIVGVRLISALKRSFVEFYVQYRKLLWTATILLALPLSFRGIADFLLQISAIKKALNTKPWASALYNLFFFLLTTYLPILFQILTLVFGFVRHNQGKLFQHPRSTRQSKVLIRDNASNLSDSDNASFFDPPIENYLNESTRVDGLVMVNQGDKNDSDTESDIAEGDSIDNQQLLLSDKKHRSTLPSYRSNSFKIVPPRENRTNSMCSVHDNDLGINQTDVAETCRSEDRLDHQVAEFNQEKEIQEELLSDDAANNSKWYDEQQ